MKIKQWKLMETLEDPNNSEWHMEDDDTTDEEEYRLMAKEPAAKQQNSQNLTRNTWLADYAD
jgi:hypothetical protein